MSINRKSIIYDIINPCKVSETDRAQAFVESEASQYAGGSGEIRFTLPTSEIMDMTESYIDALVEMNTTDAAVDTVFTLDLTGATAGTYRFSFLGQSSPVLAYNATGAEIAAALVATPTIGGFDFSVNVDDTGAPIYLITFTSDSNYGPFGNAGSFQFIEQATLTGLGTQSVLYESTSGTYAYPRLDYLNPIVRQVRVDINGQQFITISEAAILSNMIKLFQPIPEFYGEYNVNDRRLHGYYSPTQFRIKIELNHVDFLRKILPLDIIQKQIRIYLQLEQPTICLQQGPTGGGTYNVISPRIHYHRIMLGQPERQSLRDAYNNGGLVIPFQNWTTFTDTISSGTGKKNVLFNPGCSNLLAVFFVMIPEVWRSDATNPQKTSVFLRNRIGSYRLKLGSRYFPLDQVDSVNPGNDDMVEPITELEHAIANVFHISEIGYDRQVYLNYIGGLDGNLPDNVSWIPQFQELYRPSWVGGISTADTPHSQYGYICKSDALSGQDVSSLSNVSLEMKDLQLTQENTLCVYALHQDYLVIEPNNVRWIK